MYKHTKLVWNIQMPIGFLQVNPALVGRDPFCTKICLLFATLSRKVPLGEQIFFLQLNLFETEQYIEYAWEYILFDLRHFILKRKQLHKMFPFRCVKPKMSLLLWTKGLAGFFIKNKRKLYIFQSSSFDLIDKCFLLTSECVIGWYRLNLFIMVLSKILCKINCSYCHQISCMVIPRAGFKT